jgi:hypothetical protein
MPSAHGYAATAADAPLGVCWTSAPPTASAAEIETSAMAEVNDAYERTLHGDVRSRFVIDMATLPD